jgi:hypothetical protein
MKPLALHEPTTKELINFEQKYKSYRELKKELEAALIFLDFKILLLL